jgi:hypothetical protein
MRQLPRKRRVGQLLCPSPSGRGWRRAAPSVRSVSPSPPTAPSGPSLSRRERGCTPLFQDSSPRACSRRAGRPSGASRRTPCNARTRARAGRDRPPRRARTRRRSGRGGRRLALAGL